MKILLDENIPLQVMTYLQSLGFDVDYVARQTKDHLHLEDAYQQNALLITLDKDFERLVLDEGHRTAGVLHIRINTSIPITDFARIIGNVLLHRMNEIQGAFVTVTERFIHIRRSTQ